MILDVEGRPLVRDEVYLGAVNCTPFTFPMEARQLDEQYGQNRTPESVKVVELILSFHPENKVYHRLDGEMALLMAKELVRRCLPGFKAVIGVHTDGNNHSGNIHAHILVHTVCFREYPAEMEYCKKQVVGGKLSISPAQLDEMREILVKMCRRAGLFHIDISKPARRKITSGEYWAQVRGQQRLDRKNAAIESAGGHVSERVFRTDKEKIRQAVDVAIGLLPTQSWVIRYLEQNYGICIHEDEKGNWQYRMAENGRSFSASALGTGYTKKGVDGRLCAEREAEPFPVKKKESIRTGPYVKSPEEIAVYLISRNIGTRQSLRSQMEGLEERCRTTMLRRIPESETDYRSADRACRDLREELRSMERIERWHLSGSEERTGTGERCRETGKKLFRALQDRLRKKESMDYYRKDPEMIRQTMEFLRSALPYLPEDYDQPICDLDQRLPGLEDVEKQISWRLVPGRQWIDPYEPCHLISGMIMEYWFNLDADHDCRITGPVLRVLGISEDTLYHAAVRYTPEWYPLYVRRPEWSLPLPENEREGVVIVTNQNQQDGAGAVLYPDAESEIRSYPRADFVVIPVDVNRSLAVRDDPELVSQVLSEVRNGGWGSEDGVNRFYGEAYQLCGENLIHVTRKRPIVRDVWEPEPRPEKKRIRDWEMER